MLNTFSDVQLRDMYRAFHGAYNYLGGAGWQKLYVCEALTVSPDAQAGLTEAKRYIDHLLGHHCTVISWLQETRPDLVDEIRTMLRGSAVGARALPFIEYRKAWVKSIIADIETELVKRQEGAVG